MLINCLAVGAGGFIGAVFRYLIGLIPFLNKWDIPFHTLIINLIGAVIIGMVVRYAGSYDTANTAAILFLKVGLCGGFTTFSTFSLESLELLQNGKWFLFGLYAVLSLTLCIAGVWMGKWLAAFPGMNLK